ncbi:MAG: response regulator [Bdellovibrionales bacterium]|nr:response regulator [Bdellovibrionales bacterium]
MATTKVVIVDDAAFVREVLSHLLKRNGFEVVGEACDGEEAVEIVLDRNPDLVIMDIVMPKLSGIEATKRILEKNPNQKIIACSTENSEGMVGKAIEAGCVDFISKPFEGKGVIEILTSIAKR